MLQDAPNNLCFSDLSILGPLCSMCFSAPVDDSNLQAKPEYFKDGWLPLEKAPADVWPLPDTNGSGDVDGFAEVTGWIKAIEAVHGRR